MLLSCSLRMLLLLSLKREAQVFVPILVELLLLTCCLPANVRLTSACILVRCVQRCYHSWPSRQRRSCGGGRWEACCNLQRKWVEAGRGWCVALTKSLLGVGCILLLLLLLPMLLLNAQQALACCCTNCINLVVRNWKGFGRGVLGQGRGKSRWGGCRWVEGCDVHDLRNIDTCQVNTCASMCVCLFHVL